MKKPFLVKKKCLQIAKHGFVTTIKVKKTVHGVETH